MQKIPSSIGYMDYKDFVLQRGATEMHFWYRARLQLIETLLVQAMGRPAMDGDSREILDIGCGTGTEIPLLQQYGAVTALDTDHTALA